MVTYRTPTRSIYTCSHNVLGTRDPVIHYFSMHKSRIAYITIYLATMFCSLAMYTSTSSNNLSLFAYYRGGVDTLRSHQFISKVSSPLVGRPPYVGIPPDDCRCNGSPTTPTIQTEIWLGPPIYRRGQLFACLTPHPRIIEIHTNLLLVLLRFPLPLAIHSPWLLKGVPGT